MYMITLVAQGANMSPPCRTAIGLMHTEAPAGFSATAACPLQTAFLRNLSAELLLTKHQCAALSATN